MGSFTRLLHLSLKCNKIAEFGKGKFKNYTPKVGRICSLQPFFLGPQEDEEQKVILKLSSILIFLKIQYELILSRIFRHGFTETSM